jgi:hypothetical protein
MEILAWIQTIGNTCYSYCEECALGALFNYKEDMLDRVKSGKDTSFIDDDGCSFDLITEGTFQYEQYIGEIIPIEGIRCSRCDVELYPPFVGAE